MLEYVTLYAITWTLLPGPGTRLDEVDSSEGNRRHATQERQPALGQDRTQGVQIAAVQSIMGLLDACGSMPWSCTLAQRDGQPSDDTPEAVQRPLGPRYEEQDDEWISLSQATVASTTGIHHGRRTCIKEARLPFWRQNSRAHERAHGAL